MTAIMVLAEWERAVARVLEAGARTVMVIGTGDVGKSTFARWLVGRLVAAGRRADLIDSDLGQKTVGPPTAVTRGCGTPADGRTGLALTDLHFVGRTHPIGVTAQVLAGIARLRAEASADVVVVDTCGLIAGAGLELKQAKLDLLAPDVICAIEKTDELAPLLQGNRHRAIERMRPAPNVRPKSSSERRAARAAALAAHLRPGRPVALNVDALAFQRSPLFIGTPIPLAGAIYAERVGSHVVAVCPPAAAAPRGARRLRQDFARSLLCGLSAGDGRGLGLGIIDDIDFMTRTLTVLTPAPAGSIRSVRLGDLYVDRQGTEVGRTDFGGLVPG